MPRVHSERGFDVRIYLPPREHHPAHVHVVKAGGEVTIHLGTGSTPPSVVRVFGMRDADIVKAYRIVEEHQAEFLATWREYHG
jgi:hypothetical protein